MTEDCLFTDKNLKKERPQYEESENWIKNTSKRFGENVPNCLGCRLGENVIRRVAKKVTVPMCLHSFKYEIKDMTFEAPWPKWATDSEVLKKLLVEREDRFKYRLSEQDS